jgi:hypothetical protein
MLVLASCNALCKPSTNVVTATHLGTVGHNTRERCGWMSAMVKEERRVLGESLFGVIICELRHAQKAAPVPLARPHKLSLHVLYCSVSPLSLPIRLRVVSSRHGQSSA